MGNQDNIVLSLKNISKRYPGVEALSSINLDFRLGEVHAIVGENGAGKSTLIKIITGAVHANEGEIYFANEKYSNYSPNNALFNLGIAAIYQDFDLVSSLPVVDNIFLGKEIKKNIFLDHGKMNKDAEKILATIGFNINTKKLVRDLSVAEQQVVEIAKALSHDVKLLIMDEPTAPLTPNEVARLFELIERLRKHKVTIIYISHRLEEALTISDRISVLRDGKLIKTLETCDTNRKELISLMVGRKLGQEYPKHEHEFGNVLLSLNNVSTNSVKDISFDLHEKEILGIAGLVGSGRTEVANAIFGIDKLTSGEIFISGQKAVIQNPAGAMQQKIGLIPEDRKNYGILGKMSVQKNICFSIAGNICRLFFINGCKEKSIAHNFIQRLRIKTPSQDQQIQYLSGGNQQKAILSKMLASDCDVLIFDEPTCGVDVGAKQEIYTIIDELVENGKGILMISSDLPELINMSDRIMVMNSGQVEGFVSRGDVTQDLILDLASKGK